MWSLERDCGLVYMMVLGGGLWRGLGSSVYDGVGRRSLERDCGLVYGLLRRLGSKKEGGHENGTFTNGISVFSKSLQSLLLFFTGEDTD